MDDRKLSEILRELHLGLMHLLGNRLDAVYLYGSQARGDAMPDSDIDVLIVINGEFDYFKIQERISNLAWKLSLENDVVIAQVLISKDKFNCNDSPFLMNIHREAVPI
jgi:uncharacterized protein